MSRIVLKLTVQVSKVRERDWQVSLFSGVEATRYGPRRSPSSCTVPIGSSRAASLFLLYLSLSSFTPPLWLTRRCCPAVDGWMWVVPPQTSAGD